jgi:predicted MFS family arabinose efflux permease
LPAYQALIPDLVPRQQLHAASALGSVSVNLARAVGPAIAGFLIARAGVGAVFAVNAASYLFFLVVVAAWHPPAKAGAELPEQFVSALRAGSRYVRHSRVVRRILVRAVLFLVPGSALWALLPLVASQRLAQGASGYGLLLGALGVGAIAGAFLLPRLQAKLSSNTMIAAAGVVYAVALVAVVVPRNTAVIVAALLAAGFAWMAVLSHINAELQLFLPAWVRARGLSIYQMVLFGSQGIGAAAWGVAALPFGLVPTFVLAAAVMVAGVATMLVWPLVDTRDIDTRAAAYWPEPQLVFDPSPHTGPVVVSNVFNVSAENEQAFIRAMARVRRSRLRTGATQWGLFRDGETPHRFVELFAVASWDEHLRQHADRLTGADRLLEESATTLSDPPEQSSHLISVDLSD